MPTTTKSWADLFALYKDARLLRIFVLGIASGFPWVMIGSAMTAWLTEEGLTRSNIGFFGFIFVAYSINFLWAPLLDRVRLPILSRLGQRKSWIVMMQLMIAACCWYIAYASPAQELAWTKFVAFMIALASASQDIAIDAYRIDSLPEGDAERMSAGAAMATSGWWTGFAGFGAVPLLLVDQDGWGWSGVYLLMAGFTGALLVFSLFLPEPKTERIATQARSMQRFVVHLNARSTHSLMPLLFAMFATLCLTAWLIMGLPGTTGTTLSYVIFAFVLFAICAFVLFSLVKLEGATQSLPSGENAFVSPASKLHSMLAWMLVSFVEPLVEFFRRNGANLAISVLLFIFLFKIGEAFLGRMSIVFYKEVGFSNADIAVYSKLVSWWVTIVFSLIGSVVTMKAGVLKGLFIGGFAMAASNLMFALIAFAGPSKLLLVSAVVVDGFTTAWSTVAFVAFLSMMTNRAFTASQYALMASLGTLGRTFLASYSGWTVDLLDGNWALFFLLTSLMVLPSLAFLYRIRHRLRSLSEEF